MSPTTVWDRKLDNNLKKVKLNIDIMEVTDDVWLHIIITDVTDNCMKSEICPQRTAEVGNLITTEGSHEIE